MDENEICKRKFFSFFLNSLNVWLSLNFSTLRGPSRNVKKLATLEPREDTDMDLGAIYMEAVSEAMGMSGNT